MTNAMPVKSLPYPVESLVSGAYVPGKDQPEITITTVGPTDSREVGHVGPCSAVVGGPP